jgi:conjugative transfer pilus assembly protein TraH
MRITETMPVRAIAVALSLALPGAAAAGGLGDDLANFWERAGGGVNVSKPYAYDGQRAGYATLGSLYVRTRPRTTQLANIQLPSVNAGCGGIDIFGGAFSFLNAEELIALMEAIMQNATGFAFELALESMSPTVQEVVAKLRALAQQVNSTNIDSCETAQLLVGSVWPRYEAASSHICRTIGSYEGGFADMVAARHGCSAQPSQYGVLQSASPEMKEQVELDKNFAWEAIKKNAFLSSDEALAYFFQTLTGTIIITAPANDDEGPRRRVLEPRALTPQAVRMLVEGGTMQMYRCDEDDLCLDPALTDVTLSADAALYRRTETVISAMSDAISNDTALADAAVALIGMTTIPIYDTLVTAKSYKYQFVQDDISLMSELVAIDLAMAYIDEAVDEMVASAARVATLGDMSANFADSIRQTKAALGARRADAARKYAEAIRNIERITLARGELAAFSGSRFSAMVAARTD